MKPPGGWPLTLAVGFAVIVTISLSIWQVGRGIEKGQERTINLDKIESTEPLEASEYEEGESNFHKIQLTGKFDPIKTFIVAYQRHEHLPGFWIVTPFHTDYGSFLVNRGWIGTSQSYFHPPDFDTPNETLNIVGIIWPITPNKHDVGYDSASWPKRVNRFNAAKMAEITDTFSDEIRLVHGSPGVLTPIRTHLPQSSPALHWGYAFQWIVIGGLVVSGYWFFVVRRRDDEEKTT